MSPVYRSIEGNGHKISIEDFPFQGLDIPLDGYPTDAETRQSLIARFGGRVTPVGTPLVVVMREGWDYLTSDCGLCGFNIASCQCYGLAPSDEEEIG